MLIIVGFGIGVIAGMVTVLFVQGISNKQEIIPIPVTISDCNLLYQMGYEVEISNGCVSQISKRLEV